MKRIFFALFVIGSMLPHTARAEKVTLRLGHVLPVSHPLHKAAIHFADEVEARTGGSVKVIIFPAGALGGERAMAESLLLGSQDLLITSTAPLGNFVPKLRVLDIPFLFSDLDKARKSLDGSLGAALGDELREHGFETLGWGDTGFRNITTRTTPVLKPSDLRNLKIRTQENDLHIMAFRHLGAVPTPMAFPELYLALQTGVIDGQENPLSVIVSAGFYRVQRHVSLTKHLLVAAPILASLKSWQKLSEQQRTALRDAAKAIIPTWRASIDESDASALKIITKEGVAVHEVNVEAFKAALADLWPKYEQLVGKDLLDLGTRSVRD